MSNDPTNEVNGRVDYIDTDNLDDPIIDNSVEELTTPEAEPTKPIYSAKLVDINDRDAREMDAEGVEEETNYAFYPTNPNYPFEDKSIEVVKNRVSEREDEVKETKEGTTKLEVTM